MKPAYACTLLCLMLVVGCTGAFGQSIPQVTADSLNGRPISLPKDFAGKSAVLVVGFSRAGGNQCGPFARRLFKEPGVAGGSVAVYQIAMLESAPRLVRPMILHGMRGAMTDAEQSKFLALIHGEKEWKQAAGFTKPVEDDAFLLVVGPEGNVRWSGHGPYSEALYAELQRHLR